MKSLNKLNVIDRVLTNPERYKLSVVDSANSIYDLSSQAIVGTAGTKVDKALFDAIDNNFSTIDSRVASFIGTSSGAPDDTLVMGGLYLYPDTQGNGYKVKRYNGNLTEIPLTATYIGEGKTPMPSEKIPSEISTSTASSLLMQGGLHFISQSNGNYRVARYNGSTFANIPIDAQSMNGEAGLSASNLVSVTSDTSTNLIKGGIYFCASGTDGYTIKRWDGTSFTALSLVAAKAAKAESATTAGTCTGNANSATYDTNGRPLISIVSAVKKYRVLVNINNADKTDAISFSYFSTSRPDRSLSSLKNNMYTNLGNDKPVPCVGIIMNSESYFSASRHMANCAYLHNDNLYIQTCSTYFAITSDETIDIHVQNIGD